MPSFYVEKCVQHLHKVLLTRPYRVAVKQGEQAIDQGVDIGLLENAVVDIDER